VYRNSDLNYESDFYHEFFIAPRPLLTEQLRQWLDASGLFRLVLDSATRVPTTHSLEGTVSALYADFRDKASPKAVLAIEFFMTKDESAPELVLHKRYFREVSMENRAPEALAKAWSKALQQILTSFEEDLAKAL